MDQQRQQARDQAEGEHRLKQVNDSTDSTKRTGSPNTVADPTFGAQNTATKEAQSKTASDDSYRIIGSGGPQSPSTAQQLYITSQQERVNQIFHNLMDANLQESDSQQMMSSSLIESQDTLNFTRQHEESKISSKQEEQIISISPSQTQSISSPEQRSTIQKEMPSNRNFEQTTVNDQHPLSVYFRQGDQSLAFPSQSSPQSLVDMIPASQDLQDSRIQHEDSKFQSPTSFGGTQRIQGANQAMQDTIIESSQQTLQQEYPSNQVIDREYLAQREYMQHMARNEEQKHSNTLSPPSKSRMVPGATQMPTGSDKRDIGLEDREDQKQGMMSGTHSLFGSIEQSQQSPSLPTSTLGRSSKSYRSQQQPGMQVPGNLSHYQQEANRSQGQDSDNGKSSSHKKYVDPADNYQFLEGIREVDDDVDTINKSAQKDNMQGSMKDIQMGSMSSGMQRAISVNDELIRQGQIGNLYGTYTEGQDNPFVHNLQRQAMWSSGKSRDSSDQQLSFGGMFGYQEPPQIAANQGEPQIQQQLDFREQSYVNTTMNQSMVDKTNKILTKVYNQALAQMGEKACMRLLLKEMVLNLDDMNKQMCKQSVHQEIVMNEDTPNSQLYQILDISLQEQRSSARNMHQNTASLDSDDPLLTKHQKEILANIAKKSNLELIEAIRMDSRMMQLRFNDFLMKENNIYQMLAKEKERNEILQRELQRHENAQFSPGRQISPKRVAFENSELSQVMSGQTPEMKMQYNSQMPSHHKNAIQNNLTIDQLSPVSAFKMRQVQSVNMDNQFSLTKYNEQMSPDNVMSENIMRKLEDRELQIKQLNEYVESLKNEFNLFRSQQSQGTFQSPGGPENANSSQHQKMIDLHTTIYNLRRQNSQLEVQLHTFSKNDNKIKVQDGLDELMYSQRLDHLNSNSSKKQLQQPSVQTQQLPDHRGIQVRQTSVDLGSEAQTPLVQNYQAPHADSLFQPSHQNTVGRRTAMTHSLRYDPGSLESQEEDPSTVTQRQALSHHIGQQTAQSVVANSETQSLLNQEFKNLQQIADQLNLKLKEQLRQNALLKEREQEITSRLQKKEVEYAEQRVMNMDVRSQNQVNSEALDKAGKVILKLNDDLQQSLDAASKVQQANEVLKEDNRQNRRQLEDMAERVKENTLQCEAKLKKGDQEFNVEIKDLKQSLESYKKEKLEEIKNLKDQIQELTDSLNKQVAIQTSLEAKFFNDHKEFTAALNKKNLEALDLHDKNLSIRIEMNKNEQALEQDVAIREEKHQHQSLFLKNQINEMKTRFGLKQNEIRYGTKTGNGELMIDQNGEKMPRVNESYLQELQKEFLDSSNELLKVRKILNEQISENTKILINERMKEYEDFKVRVLNALVDWYQKSTELGKVANKYFNQLEEYKMLFVQMKQMMKEKDVMLLNMRKHVAQFRQTHDQGKEQIKVQMEESYKVAVEELKKMTKTLEDRVKNKERECQELITYQEEFRGEYVKVCHQRDELLREKDIYQNRAEYLEREFDQVKKEYHEFKEKLRNQLEIQEGPHKHSIIPQHIGSLQEMVKTQKLQITHYQDKNLDLTNEVENQRQMFQLKMGEMEQQLESQSKQYLSQQDEAQDKHLMKESELETEVALLKSEIEKQRSELQMRERQTKKHDAKLESETDKQNELKKEMEALILEKNKIMDQKQAVKDAYDIIEEKLKATQEHLDTRVIQVDDLDRQLRGKFDETDRLQVNIQKLTSEIEDLAKSNQNLNLEMHREKEQVLSYQSELKNLNETKQNLQKQLTFVSQAENQLAQKSQKDAQTIKELDAITKQDNITISHLQTEIKRYQDSVAYLSRQIDEDKLQQLNCQVLENEKGQLQDYINEQQNEIDQLVAKYVDCPKADQGVQTSDAFLNEIHLVHQEISYKNMRILDLEEEIEQFRSALQRQMSDMNGVIEEKRQLESEIEQKNLLLSRQNANFRDSAENINVSNLRNRSNSPNRSNLHVNSTDIGSYADARQKTGKSYESITLVLNEKQNYIAKLERELTDLRKENESMKDKIIVYELENIGGTFKQRSPGPHDSNTNYDTRTMAHSNINQSAYNNTRNMAGTQAVRIIDQHAAPIRPGTQNISAQKAYMTQTHNPNFQSHLAYNDYIPRDKQPNLAETHGGIKTTYKTTQDNTANATQMNASDYYTLQLSNKNLHQATLQTPPNMSADSNPLFKRYLEPNIHQNV